jgi:hypothetical protein
MVLRAVDVLLVLGALRRWFSVVRTLFALIVFHQHVSTRLLNWPSAHRIRCLLIAQSCSSFCSCTFRTDLLLSLYLPSVPFVELIDMLSEPLASHVLLLVFFTSHIFN